MLEDGEGAEAGSLEETRRMGHEMSALYLQAKRREGVEGAGVGAKEGRRQRG